jgi:hypothetical protein
MNLQDSISRPLLLAGIFVLLVQFAGGLAAP